MTILNKWKSRNLSDGHIFFVKDFFFFKDCWVYVNISCLYLLLNRWIYLVRIFFSSTFSKNFKLHWKFVETPSAYVLCPMVILWHKDAILYFCWLSPIFFLLLLLYYYLCVYGSVFPLKTRNRIFETDKLPPPSVLLRLACFWWPDVSTIFQILLPWMKMMSTEPINSSRFMDARVAWEITWRVKLVERFFWSRNLNVYRTAVEYEKSIYEAFIMPGCNSSHSLFF